MLQVSLYMNMRRCYDNLLDGCSPFNGHHSQIQKKTYYLLQPRCRNRNQSSRTAYAPVAGALLQFSRQGCEDWPSSASDMSRLTLIVPSLSFSRVSDNVYCVSNSGCCSRVYSSISAGLALSRARPSRTSQPCRQRSLPHGSKTLVAVAHGGCYTGMICW